MQSNNGITSMSINDFNIIALLRKVAQNHKTKELGFINHQRQTIALFYAIAVSICALSNITQFSGACNTFFATTSTILLVITLTISFCYTAKILDLAHTTVLQILSCQTVMAVDNIFCAMTPTLPDNDMAILLNMLIMEANTVITLAAYLIPATYVASVISFITYTVCVLLTGNETLIKYFFLVFMVFAFICFLASRVTKVARRLQEENQMLRRDEEELLQIFRMNKEEIKAYISIAKYKQTTEETATFLNMLDATAQNTLINNVSRYIQSQATQESILEEKFPNFTPTEIQICQLILRGKKQSEICAILSKTESNISTQRANIRKKLGLQPTDNLHKALTERMKQNSIS